MTAFLILNTISKRAKVERFGQGITISSQRLATLITGTLRRRGSGSAMEPRILMNQRRTAGETREIIFEACGQILRRDGLTNLTLDKVAAEAALSKGGLLYHFPNKASLIMALFEYHNNLFEARLSALTDEEGESDGAWLRAYLRACIEQITTPGNASLYTSLFAAEEQYDNAHGLMLRKYDAWQQQVEDSGLDPIWATLVRLAVDGFWFAEMHNYAPPNGERREKIIDLLLKLTTDLAQDHK